MSSCKIHKSDRQGQEIYYLHNFLGHHELLPGSVAPPRGLARPVRAGTGWIETLQDVGHQAGRTGLCLEAGCPDDHSEVRRRS